MKIITQIRFYLVVAIIAFLSLLINYFKLKDELTKCQTDTYSIEGGDIQKAQLQSTIDSLNNELFVKNIQIGTYEVMWNILQEVNKPLADSIDLQVE